MLRVEAPAKLNLYLHVTGRRPDGYHTLDSLITFVSLADTLEIAPADTLGLSVTGPFSTALDPGDNLVTRAARALAGAVGRDPAVAITLHKRIPVAAGLGGGSGDAAAVLRALAELWDVGADRQQELLRIALSLGADVPVCLHGSAAYVGGIGEVLSEPPKLPGSAVLLINPGVAVPTGPVFAAREGPFSTTNRFSESPQNAQELAAALAARHNDLERPARAQVPVIAQVLDRLNAESGCLLSRMTGSGGTCFGLFEDDIATQRAADAIAQEKPAWWVCPTRLAHN